MNESITAIESLPVWIPALFLFAAGASLVFFYFSNKKALKLTIGLFLLSAVHCLLAYKGFYLDFEASPPRFILVLLPTTVLIIVSLLPRFRERFLSHRNYRVSTFLHVVRVPVEVVLFQLFLAGTLPELMTFEGRNFDIVAGISAPIVGLLFLRGIISKKVLLAWNIFGLGLVLFILFNGILSAELPIQLFAFAQPNHAVAFFPFILLPSIVVPIVVWTHLIDILKLRRELKAMRLK